MSTYKITVTPAGPYFFGNEKSFRYPGQNNGGAYSNSYFIKSEDVPSQSTILGALRFILIPHKNFPDDPEKIKENAEAVGKSGFNIELPVLNGFGKIKSISPLFITCGEKRIIPLPLNHNTTDKSGMYKPLADLKPVETVNGKKYFADDFDVKEGITSDYVEVSEEPAIIKKDDIFNSSVRVGINRGSKEKGFFKKEYKALRRGFSFAVYADIDEELDGRNETVCLGQGKSPFSFCFAKTSDTEYDGFKESIAVMLGKFSGNENLIYCFGDAFTNGNPCDNTMFAVFNTKDFRTFRTDQKGKIAKDGILYRLVKSGSVFITAEGGTDEWVKQHTNEYAQTIGYNHFIISEGKK